MGNKPKKKPELEDLEAKVVIEAGKLMTFGRRGRGNPDYYAWTDSMTNKEKIDCAKIRSGIIKDVLNYLYSKRKPADEEIDTNTDVESLLKGASTEELKQMQAAAEAQETLSDKA